MGRHSEGCLDLHGAHYRLRVQVPRHLRGFFNGQHSLVQLLPTDSKVEANRMKAGVVELMLEQIRLAERRHVDDERSAPIDKQMLWAEWVSAVKRAQKNGGELPGPKFPVWLRIPWPGNSREMHSVFWMLHRKGADENIPRFEAFRATVEGQATPLETLLPIYMKESARRPTQEADSERAVRKFIKFMVGHDKPITIEHLTRRMVGEWVIDWQWLSAARLDVSLDAIS
jgi:hypothetical protein